MRHIAHIQEEVLAQETLLGSAGYCKLEPWCSFRSYCNRDIRSLQDGGKWRHWRRQPFHLGLTGTPIEGERSREEESEEDT